MTYILALSEAGPDNRLPITDSTHALIERRVALIVRERHEIERR